MTGQVFLFDTKFLCTLGALANGVYIKQGSDRANVVARTRPYRAARNLKDLQKWVVNLIGFMSPDKFREYDGSEKKQFDLHWVLNHMTGVALVRLRGTPGVDHLICVDTDQRKIYDSMEKKPLKLCAEDVKACCGENAHLDEIAECRKVTVYAQPTKRVRRGKSARQKKKRDSSRSRYPTVLGGGIGKS